MLTGALIHNAGVEGSNHTRLSKKHTYGEEGNGKPPH